MACATFTLPDSRSGESSPGPVLMDIEFKDNRQRNISRSMTGMGGLLMQKSHQQDEDTNRERMDKDNHHSEDLLIPSYKSNEIFTHDLNESQPHEAEECQGYIQGSSVNPDPEPNFQKSPMSLFSTSPSSDMSTIGDEEEQMMNLLAEIEVKDKYDIQSSCGLIEIWKLFSQQSSYHRNAASVLKRIMKITAQVILAASWAKVTDTDKTCFIEHLRASSVYMENEDEPAWRKMCHNIEFILKTNLWQLPHLQKIYDDKGLTVESANSLWEAEGCVFLETRLEKLCQAKAFDNAILLAEACVLKGYSLYENHQTMDDGFSPFYMSQDKYYQFTAIFALILHRQEVEDDTHRYYQLKKYLTPSFCMETVNRLTNPESFNCIASKWKKGWKYSEEAGFQCLEVALLDIIEKEVSLEALKMMFTMWLRLFVKLDADEHEKELNEQSCGPHFSCHSTSSTFRIPTEEIENMVKLACKNDYVYVLADSIINEFATHPLARSKCLELYVPALISDINKLESLKTNDSNRDEVKEFEQKLSLYYQKLADYFQEDGQTKFELLLTCFSLNPSQDLLLSLGDIAEGNNRKDGIVNVCEKVSAGKKATELGISLVLYEGLLTIMTNPRWTRLNCFRQSWEEFKPLCFKHLETRGEDIKGVKDLELVRPDYSKYENLKPAYDENDNGYEPGYGPSELDIPLEEEENEPISKKIREPSHRLRNLDRLNQSVQIRMENINKRNNTYKDKIKRIVKAKTKPSISSQKKLTSKEDLVQRSLPDLEVGLNRQRKWASSPRGRPRKHIVLSQEYESISSSPVRKPAKAKTLVQRVKFESTLPSSLPKSHEGDSSIIPYIPLPFPPDESNWIFRQNIQREVPKDVCSWMVRIPCDATATTFCYSQSHGAMNFEKESEELEAQFSGSRSTLTMINEKKKPYLNSKRNGVPYLNKYFSNNYNSWSHWIQYAEWNTTGIQFSKENDKPNLLPSDNITSLPSLPLLTESSPCPQTCPTPKPVPLFASLEVESLAYMLVDNSPKEISQNCETPQIILKQYESKECLALPISISLTAIRTRTTSECDLNPTHECMYLNDEKSPIIQTENVSETFYVCEDFSTEVKCEPFVTFLSEQMCSLTLSDSPVVCGSFTGMQVLDSFNPTQKVSDPDSVFTDNPEMFSVSSCVPSKVTVYDLSADSCEVPLQIPGKVMACTNVTLPKDDPKLTESVLVPTLIPEQEQCPNSSVSVLTSAGDNAIIDSPTLCVERSVESTGENIEAVSSMMFKDYINPSFPLPLDEERDFHPPNLNKLSAVLSVEASLNDEAINNEEGINVQLPSSILETKMSGKLSLSQVEEFSAGETTTSTIIVESYATSSPASLTTVQDTNPCEEKGDIHNFIASSEVTAKNVDSTSAFETETELLISPNTVLSETSGEFILSEAFEPVEPAIELSISSQVNECKENTKPECPAQNPMVDVVENKTEHEEHGKPKTKEIKISLMRLTEQDLLKWRRTVESSASTKLTEDSPLPSKFNGKRKRPSLPVWPSNPIITRNSLKNIDIKLENLEDFDKPRLPLQISLKNGHLKAKIKGNQNICNEIHPSIQSKSEQQEKSKCCTGSPKEKSGRKIRKRSLSLDSSNEKKKRTSKRTKLSKKIKPKSNQPPKLVKNEEKLEEKQDNSENDISDPEQSYDDLESPSENYQSNDNGDSDFIPSDSELKNNQSGSDVEITELSSKIKPFIPSQLVTWGNVSFPPVLVSMSPRSDYIEKDPLALGPDDYKCGLNGELYIQPTQEPDVVDLVSDSEIDTPEKDNTSEYKKPCRKKRRIIPPHSLSPGENIEGESCLVTCGLDPSEIGGCVRDLMIEFIHTETAESLIDSGIQLSESTISRDEIQLASTSKIFGIQGNEKFSTENAEESDDFDSNHDVHLSSSLSNGEIYSEVDTPIVISDDLESIDPSELNVEVYAMCEEEEADLQILSEREYYEKCLNARSMPNLTHDQGKDTLTIPVVLLGESINKNELKPNISNKSDLDVDNMPYLRLAVVSDLESTSKMEPGTTAIQPHEFLDDEPKFEQNYMTTKYETGFTGNPELRPEILMKLDSESKTVSDNVRCHKLKPEFEVNLGRKNESTESNPNVVSELRPEISLDDCECNCSIEPLSLEPNTVAEADLKPETILEPEGEDNAERDLGILEELIPETRVVREVESNVITNSMIVSDLRHQISVDSGSMDIENKPMPELRVGAGNRSVSWKDSVKSDQQHSPYENKRMPKLYKPNILPLTEPINSMAQYMIELDTARVSWSKENNFGSRRTKGRKRLKGQVYTLLQKEALLLDEKCPFLEPFVDSNQNPSEDTEISDECPPVLVCYKPLG